MIKVKLFEEYHSTIPYIVRKNTTVSNIENFSMVELENILYCAKDDYLTKYRDTFDNELIDNYGMNPNSKMNIEITSKLRKLFTDNLKIEIKDGLIVLSSEYKYDFPSYWDKRTIEEYTPNFNILTMDYLLLNKLPSAMSRKKAMSLFKRIESSRLNTSITKL